MVSYVGGAIVIRQIFPPPHEPETFLAWFIVCVGAIPTFWFCTPLAVFLFFRGTMKLWPHLLGVALVCVFVPGLILSVFAKGHNFTFAFCVLGVAVLNAFLIWWVYKLFERVRRAVVTKAISVIDAYIESPRG